MKELSSVRRSRWCLGDVSIWLGEVSYENTPRFICGGTHRLPKGSDNLVEIEGVVTETRREGERAISERSPLMTMMALGR